MPALLAFCSPYYEAAALNEIATVLSTRVERSLSPGVFLLHSTLPEDLTNCRSEAAPFIFTRQLVVGLKRIHLCGDIDTDLSSILEVAPPDAMKIGRSFVCFPSGSRNDILISLHNALAVRMPPVPSAFAQSSTHALAVVVTGQDAWVGLALRSPWAAGRPQFDDAAGTISRAAFKLLEALDTFTIPVRAGMQALDLGAFPGGWTQVLATRNFTVVAVDPGALDPRVASLPGVELHKTLAQNYLPQADRTFDLVINDMRLDARESAHIMVQAGDVLHPDGVGLMTIKLPQRAPTAIIRATQARLRSAYPVQQVRCLYFNRHEVTVYLRRQD